LAEIHNHQTHIINTVLIVRVMGLDILIGLLLMSFLRVTLCIEGMVWMIWDFIPGGGKRFFCTQKCPDWLWGPSCLLFSRYCGSFLGGKLTGAGS
jgi:hypothetical protein